MRIIEHGDKFELGEITCCNCHCKFAYNKSDIKIYVWTGYIYEDLVEKKEKLL